MADGLGSSLSLTDASGTVQTEYTYGAFGSSASTGAASNNSSQYTGRENDGTGLQYNRARYYSPALQRFISEDPIGLAGGDNVYAYVGNNPISFTDPSGLQTGPTNYLRDPFSADNWIGNGAANTISDLLNLDGFAEWSWVAGDHCRPASDRAWAGAKIIGGAALAAGGGVIARGVGRGIGAGARLLRGAGPAADAAVGGAGSLADAILLKRGLASAEQVGGVGARTIAGQGSGKAFRDAPQIAAEYGGSAADWVKKSSSTFRGTFPDSIEFQTHWVENLKTGLRVEFKTVPPH